MLFGSSYCKHSTTPPTVNAAPLTVNWAPPTVNSAPPTVYWAPSSLTVKAAPHSVNAIEGAAFTV